MKKMFSFWFFKCVVHKFYTLDKKRQKCPYLTATPVLDQMRRLKAKCKIDEEAGQQSDFGVKYYDQKWRTIAKGPETTTWIWNLHDDAHDFDSHTSDLKFFDRKGVCNSS